MKNISVTDGRTTMRGILNDTVAAKDFARRLPATFCGVGSGTDYCCAAASGLFDPTEFQADCQNGDICLGGGRLIIICAGDEISADRRGVMVIGNILPQDTALLKALPRRVSLTISITE